MDAPFYRLPHDRRICRSATRLAAALAVIALAFVWRGPAAKAQDIRALVADTRGGHGRIVERELLRTASDYGLTADVSVRNIGSAAELTDTAIEEGYNVVVRAITPFNSNIVDASARAWENGVAFISPHGVNRYRRYEVTPGVTEEGPLFIGGENLEEGGDGSYGGNLELDVLTLGGEARQSYTIAAGAAILAWAYKNGTDSTALPADRWRSARGIMRELAGVYEDIPTPSALNSDENELPENMATLENWRTYRGATVTRTVREDESIRIEVSGGSHEMKLYRFGGHFPAGAKFSQFTITNQGSESFAISRGVYDRSEVRPGETRTFILRHSFRTKRDRVEYRLWAESADASVDAVFEPIILNSRQPALQPDYAAERTDERGEGLVIATRAGLLDTDDLGPAERMYAQQQQARLDEIVEANLPVELESFTGTVDGQAALLRWRTLSEVNSRGFYVEQKDGPAWRRASPLIETAAGEGGTSQEAHRYTHRVEDLAFGHHVFRLRQVDRDGQEEVFTRQTVELSVRLADGAYRLTEAYPNPARDRATVEFAVEAPQSVTVALYNVLGQRIRVLQEGHAPGNETRVVTFDTSGLASGTYFVRVKGERFSDSTPVTVVR